jgi:hypothetical protein
VRARDANLTPIQEKAVIPAHSSGPATAPGGGASARAQGPWPAGTSRRRGPTLLVALGAMLAVLVPVSSVDPSAVLEQPPPPSMQDLALLELLAAADRPETALRLFAGDDDFPDLLDPQPRRFELFRSFHERRHSRRLLATMPYGSLIAEAAERYRLDGLLLAAVVEAESGYDPRAISPRGALGLMQLMPATAAHYGATEPADPRANVRAGARYLRDLLRRFDDDLELALAAYNAGPANVARYGGVPPFRETTAYVERVLRIYLRLHHEVWLESMRERTGGVAVATARSL